MKRTKRTIIRSWKQAHTLLERWRRELASVEVTLKRPRVVGVVPLDFVSGDSRANRQTSSAGTVNQTPP